ncbi:uncharacterized protein MONOS_5076 [Monocercomonoides exilis]|uniref:uncharacterized protein n=1 Tax=Monocercomonoides exilis TaxID=2049356 RepID=UPI00355ACB8B|nr:hypothetical protein MONOS_5076 [Monocercomonoides exilis]|eukprot:MONOS_5076.1-p1 / transcript=MONOS_5076.1 / gene=MONOS_5076 / organism=Monocercomonoides_exilis_PA203 / gene_product=unspecified product / transcript_product=unspecified product / location=Mono_scaffold00144:31012-32209(+) / protein_length=287 / sequence_SO=supercontig / SO=protein_coding / is_pseudo=false
MKYYLVFLPQLMQVIGICESVSMTLTNHFLESYSDYNIRFLSYQLELLHMNLKACAPSFCSELEGRFKLFLGTYDNYPVDREKLKWLQSFVGRVLSGFFSLAGAQRAVSSASLQPIGSEEPAIPIAERERRFIESLGKQQETHTANDPRFPAQIPTELLLPYAACSPPFPSAQPRSDCMGSSLDRSSCSSSLPSSNSSSHPPPFSLFSSSSSPPSMHSAASLNVHLNCFPLPQRRIPLCFSTSYGFRALAVLNRVNDVNGHRMRNGGGRGKELQGALRSSARFMTP